MVALYAIIYTRVSRQSDYLKLDRTRVGVLKMRATLIECRYSKFVAQASGLQVSVCERSQAGGSQQFRNQTTQRARRRGSPAPVSGLCQRTRGKRAKSMSAVCTTARRLRASAASWASVVKLAVAPALRSKPS